MRVIAFLRNALAFTSIAISSYTFAAGPTSFGEIKLGMSKAEVEGVAQDEPIRLVGSLSPSSGPPTVPTEPDEEWWTGKLITPFSSTPLTSSFRFKAGKLALMSFKVEDERAFERMIEQVTQKYGKAEVEDRMKEEQCIYGNGSNFKVKNGSLQHQWTQDTPEGPVVTIFNEYRGGGCPPSLRMGITAFGFRHFTIAYPKKVPPKKSAF